MPKIKQMREQRGLTQSEVGAWLGKDKRDISKFENSYFFPTRKDLLVLLKNFDCSVLDLFSEEELPVATSKTLVATHERAKARVTNYNFCVRVNRADFPLLTKNTLSECGFHNLRDLLATAYAVLEKRYKKINKKEV